MPDRHGKESTQPAQAPTGDGSGHGPPDEPTSRSSLSFTLVLSFIGLVLIIPAVALGVYLVRSSGPVEHRYVVEAGTGDRLDRGERVETMPAELDARVGDSLVIVNDDDRTHVVGPFGVRAGETFYYRFSERGEIRDACTLQPDGEIVIRIN